MDVVDTSQKFITYLAQFDTYCRLVRNVGELFRAAEKFLVFHNISNAHWEGKWLLAHILNCAPLDIHLRTHETLDKKKISILGNFLARRCLGEPLQYILGNALFGDLELLVDRRVLIPRPETNELIDRIVAHYDECGYKPNSILDLGTGSGAIILLLGKKFPKADLHACDRSYEALQVAHYNAKYHHLEKRIYFSQSSWFNAYHSGKCWDLIVANPPYLSEKEWETAQIEVRNYEPKEALVSFRNGLGDLEIIIRQATKFLNSNGLLALETGINHHKRLSELAQTSGFRQWKSFSDSFGHPRMLFLIKIPI
jgi:release factor glutamine methyltransferase